MSETTLSIMTAFVVVAAMRIARPASLRCTRVTGVRYEGSVSGIVAGL